MYDLPCNFMKLSDSLGIAAGNDYSLLIHDVNIIAGIFGNLFNQFFRQ